MFFETIKVHRWSVFPNPVTLITCINNIVRRLGRDCGFKEENEIVVAVKYVKEKG